MAVPSVSKSTGMDEKKDYGSDLLSSEHKPRPQGADFSGSTPGIQDRGLISNKTSCLTSYRT